MNWSLNSRKFNAIIYALTFGFIFPFQVAFSTENTNSISTLASQKKYATVWRISGRVTASHNSIGKERLLQEDDPVYVGDLLKADPLSEATLKTEDAGMIAIRPKTEFLADKFSDEGNNSDSFSIHLLKGSLRIISGWISHTNRDGVAVTTATATMGVRGTDHEPYVISAEMALGTPNKEGTYDKVNRGGTTLKVGDAGIDIDAGKVGFAREPENGSSGRALMTLLLPVILDKVPSFYVPGKFDADLDQYSETADRVSRAKLDYKLKKTNLSPASDCLPVKIAKSWLGQLDSALALKDSQQIISMFAPDVAVRATILDSNGKTNSLDIKREEFVQSTIEAMKGLKDYQQHRVSIDAKLANVSGDTKCNLISVQSGVVEEGFQSDNKFRFESLEEYLLELHDGKWLSIKASTTQK